MASASPVVWSPTRTPARNSPRAVASLELIGIKGSASSDHGADVEVGGGELTIYDNLDAKTGELAPEGPLPRSPPAHHPQHPGVQAHAERRRVLARQRETRCSSAPRHRLALQEELKAHLDFLGRPSATTASWATSWTSSPSRTRSARASPSSTPGRHHPPGHGGLLAAPPRGRGLRVRLHPARDEGEALRALGHLDWYADGMYPPMQLDEGVDYYLKPMNCPMHNLIFDATLLLVP